MLHHARRPMTKEEVIRLEDFVGRRRAWNMEYEVEEYTVSVDSCVVPINQNPDHPVYFLDVGGKIMILFGQWLSHPAIATVWDEPGFDWNIEECFLEDFKLSVHAESAMVLELASATSNFVPLQPSKAPVRFTRLREFEMIDGGAQTLIEDLRRAGIAQ